MGRGRRDKNAPAPAPNTTVAAAPVFVPVPVFDAYTLRVTDGKRSRRYEAEPSATRMTWDEHATKLKGDRFAVQATIPHWAAGPVVEALRDLGTDERSETRWETPEIERSPDRWWHSVEVHPTGMVTVASHIRKRGGAAVDTKHPISVSPAARSQLARDLSLIAEGKAANKVPIGLGRLHEPTSDASLGQRLFGARG